MTKCYDKNLKNFAPFETLELQRKAEIASLVKVEIDELLNDIKNVKRMRKTSMSNMATLLKNVTGKTEETELIYQELSRCLQAGLSHLFSTTSTYH